MHTSRWQFPPSLKLIRPSVASLYRYCCWYVTWPCDLDLWPFDFGQWSYMAGHVVNPSTKFEDPTAIRSWVIGSDISHRIPLTYRSDCSLQPLRMRRITWPMRSVKFFPHIWNPWPWFAYSLYKNCQRQLVEHSIAFRAVSIYWQWNDPFPLNCCLLVTCPLLSMVSYGKCQNS